MSPHLLIALTLAIGVVCYRDRIPPYHSGYAYYTIQTKIGRSCNHSCQHWGLTCDFTELKHMRRNTAIDLMRNITIAYSDKLINYSVKDGAMMDNIRINMHSLPAIIQEAEYHNCSYRPTKKEQGVLCRCVMPDIKGKPGECSLNNKRTFFTFVMYAKSDKKKRLRYENCPYHCARHPSGWNMPCLDNCTNPITREDNTILRKLIMMYIERTAIRLATDASSYHRYKIEPILVLPQMKILGYDPKGKEKKYDCDDKSYIDTEYDQRKYRICECHGKRSWTTAGVPARRRRHPLKKETESKETTSNRAGEASIRTESEGSAATTNGRAFGVSCVVQVLLWIRAVNVCLGLF